MMLRSFRRPFPKQVHEVDLALARHFGRAGDVAFTAGADARPFLDLHPARVDAALRGHVPGAAALVQIAVGAQPVEKAVLAHLIARGLLDELGHLAHEDGGLRHLDGFRKHHLGPVGRGLCFQRLPLFPLRLEVCSQPDQGVRVQQRLLQPGGRQVGAVAPDAGHHVPGYPHLVGEGGRFVGTGKEEVEPLLGDDEHLLLATGGHNPITTLPFIRDMPEEVVELTKGTFWVAQRPSHILGHEPGVTVHIHDAHSAEFGVPEDLHFTHTASFAGAGLELVLSSGGQRSGRSSDKGIPSP